ncbi:hypothetical protein VTN49DRAFT_3706 [Thermomyces lanuginosus]|uniref:uncharacterized protein n=1 Tax=Thermomyces lanuginosus TaxID=5541 RepID=UPI0037445610
MTDISSSLSFLTDNSVASALRDAYHTFSERRAALGLPNPGTVDNLAKEVQKDVLLSNYMFTGFRADLTKVFGVTPLFRMSHALAMGGSGNLPPYAFSAMYGTPKVFMQGNLGSDGGLSAVCNYRWNSKLVTKLNAQIMSGASQGILQIDNDYTGNDFSLSLKAFNPSFLEGGLTGIVMGNYLQSVTPSLALGFEALWQRQSLSTRPETMLSYCAKYRGSGWLATAQLQAQGVLAASYWRKLSEKVEAGVDLNLQFAANPAAAMMGAPSRDGTATIGAKYDFRASTFRAQVDSAGKVSCLLEKRIAMPIAITFAGEIDQVKQQAKLGLAVSLEIGGEELMEQQERAEAQGIPPPPF